VLYWFKCLFKKRKLLSKETLLKGWKQSKYIIIKDKDLNRRVFGDFILEILEDSKEVTIMSYKGLLELHVKTTFRSLTRKGERTEWL